MIKFLRFMLPVLFMLALSVQGQNTGMNFPVTQDKLNTDAGSQAAYTVHIPEAEADNVMKAWSKTIRAKSKAKPEQEGSHVKITGTEIHSIHHGPINIFSMIYKVDTSVRVVAVFEIDSAFFVPPSNEANHTDLKTHHHIEKFMQQFAREQYREVVNEKLDAEKDKLKDLEKEHKNLLKENENLKKDISDHEQSIRNSQDAISTYENDNSRLLADITAKRDAIAGLSGDEALRDEAKSQLKSLEKEKKNTEGKLAKEQKNIVGYESQIEELNREVEANEKNQEAIRGKIDKQKEQVKMVAEHLNQI